MDLNIAGKQALVTGSSRGIGEAIAKGIAREGASVVVHGRNADEARRVARQIVETGADAAVVLGSLDTDEGARLGTLHKGYLTAFRTRLLKKPL